MIQPVPAVRGSLAPIPRFDLVTGQPEVVMPSRSEASAFSMAGLKLSTSTESWKHKVQHERRAALKKWLALVDWIRLPGKLVAKRCLFPMAGGC